MSRAEPCAVRIAKSGAVVSVPTKEFDFLRWHKHRQNAERPPLGRTPRHKVKGNLVFKPLALDELKVQEKERTAQEELMMTSAQSFKSYDSSWSDNLNAQWASQTDSMWRQRPKRQAKRVPANARHEKTWAKSVFRTLPKVGPTRSSQSASARLTANASAPELSETHVSHDLKESSHPGIIPHGMRRLSSIESCASDRPGSNRLESRQSNGVASEAEHFPENPAVEKRGNSKRPSVAFDLGLRRPSKGGMGMSILHGGGDGHHHGKSDVADLAHRWCLPLSTVTEASQLFERHATVGEGQDMLRDGVLYTDAMMKLTMRLAEKASMDEMSATPGEIMGIIDKNSDGSVDFYEFVSWYHERAFLEYMNLTKAEIEVRRVGQRLGICVADMDGYKAQFDRFDGDKSGVIDINEFRELMHILMKVPHDLRIPDSRIHHFWQECDSNGSGCTDLEEFVAFFVKHFDPESNHPMEDYYKAIRRVEV